MGALTNTSSVTTSDRVAVGPKQDNSKPDGGASAGGTPGTGDVVGPVGAVAGHVAVFASATGKLIGDSGYDVVGNVATIAALRALAAAPLHTGDVFVVEGYSGAGDGGGGLFYWDAAAVAADDSGMIIKITAVANGRFRRIRAGTVGTTIYANTIDVRWFGAIPDYASDVSAAVHLAYAALVTGGCLYFPAGNYLFNTPLVIKNATGAAAKSVTFRGDGTAATVWIYNSTTTGILEVAEDAVMTLVEILDIGMISLHGRGSGAEAFVALFLAASTLRIDNVFMSAFPNVIAIKAVKSGSFVRNFATDTPDGGCQWWQEGGRLIMDQCNLSTGLNPSADSLPCVAVKGSGGASSTVNQIRDCYFKGAGPWTSYDGGVAYITVVISGDDGTLNEGQIEDCLLDSVYGGGNPSNSIALLIECTDNAYVVTNWTLDNLWLNAGVIGLKAYGVDVGGGQTVKGISATNLFTRPSASAGVDLEGCNSVTLLVHTAAVGANGIGVKISNGGANDAVDFTIYGKTSSQGDTACLTGVEVNGTKVKHVTAFMTCEGVTNPYNLTGGANKATQALVFNWPDGGGGMNCSGPITQNV